MHLTHHPMLIRTWYQKDVWSVDHHVHLVYSHHKKDLLITSSLKKKYSNYSWYNESEAEMKSLLFWGGRLWS